MIKLADKLLTIPEHVRLSEDVMHLSKGKEHVLVKKFTGQWAKMTAEAMQIVDLSKSMSVEKVVNYASKKYHHTLNEFASLFEFLYENAILVPADQADNSSLGLSEEVVAPESVTFSVTERCNLKCRTCYMDSVSSYESELLGLSEIKIILERLADSGCVNIKITGGEPLLRADIFEILSYARKRFKRIVIETNGALISRKRATMLKNFVDRVNIGISGCNAAEHDQIRGKGNFRRTRQGIEILKSVGFDSIRLVYIRTGINSNDLELDKLAQKLGVDLITCSFMPAGRGKINRDLFQIISKAKLLSQNASKEHNIPIIDYYAQRCPAATRKIYVSADGTVYPCDYLTHTTYTLGNLLKHNNLVSSIASSEVAQIIFKRKNVDEFGPCKKCSVRYICGGGCMARSYHWSGDIMETDPYCQFIKEGIEKRIWS